MPNGHFAFHDKPIKFSWVHAVMNFIGPNEGQGIRIYNNGKLIGNDTTKSNEVNSPSDGQIQLGRIDLHHTGTTSTLPFYSAVEVDELLIYNRTVTEPEIILLSQIPCKQLIRMDLCLKGGRLLI